MQPKYKFRVPACIDWGTSRRTSPEWDSFGAIEATPLTPPYAGNRQWQLWGDGARVPGGHGTRNGRLQAAGRIVWAVSDPQGGPRVADGACTRLSVSWGPRTGLGTEAPGEDRCCSAVEVHLRVLRTARVVSRPAGTPRRVSRLHGPIHVPFRVRKHLVHAHRLLEARDPYRGADVVLAARTSTRSTFSSHYRGHRARPIQTHHEPLRNGFRARAGHLDDHRSRNDLKSTKSTVFFRPPAHVTPANASNRGCRKSHMDHRPRRNKEWVTRGRRGGSTRSQTPERALETSFQSQPGKS